MHPDRNGCNWAAPVGPLLVSAFPFTNVATWWKADGLLWVDHFEDAAIKAVMSPKVVIRAERPEDAPVIAELVSRAYAAVPYSDHREHLMVARLRDSPAFVPELSLLAEAEGAALGHIMLTRATIGRGSGAIITLALAPLSVVPEAQGKGVGKRLVAAAHRRATELGFESILLVGLPDYYQQFGYERLSAYPITLPFDAAEANCMILALTPNALDGVTGQVEYAEAWLDH